MLDKHEKEKAQLLLKFKRQRIPRLKEWSWEELDALNIISQGHPGLTPELLDNFKCSVSELRSAIAAQLTCADWSSGTDQVQHFATFLLSGSAPMSQYTERAIELLTSYIEVVKANPEHYESDDIQKLEAAISFLARFK
jgi:hypothetical protein